MRISLIIATMNRAQDLSVTFDYIEKQILFPDEIIIVDQSTNSDTKQICDERREFINKKGSVLKYFFQEKPSLVAARNRGVQESVGELVFFIDDDIALEKDYIYNAAKYFSDSAIGGVTGNVTNMPVLKGVKWEIRKFLTRLFLISDFNGHLTASGFGYPIFERVIDHVQEVELFAGYSMCFRRDLLLKNPCDEWFVGYGFREDVDLSYRISRGAKLLIVPDARFEHRISAVNRLDLFRLKRMQFRNYRYLFLKLKKKKFINEALFFYSICGLIVLAGLELIGSGFKDEKAQILKADLAALKSLYASTRTS